MSKAHWYLFCYDIASPKRLQKVHRRLRNEGLPLQYSVFLVLATGREYRHLLKTIRPLINEHYDDIRVYPVSSKIEYVMLGRQSTGSGTILQEQGLIRLD